MGCAVGSAALRRPAEQVCTIETLAGHASGPFGLSATTTVTRQEDTRRDLVERWRAVPLQLPGHRCPARHRRLSVWYRHGESCRQAGSRCQDHYRCNATCGCRSHGRRHISPVPGRSTNNEVRGDRRATTIGQESVCENRVASLPWSFRQWDNVLQYRRIASHRVHRPGSHGRRYRCRVGQCRTTRAVDDLRCRATVHGRRVVPGSARPDARRTSRHGALVRIAARILGLTPPSRCGKPVCTGSLCRRLSHHGRAPVAARHTDRRGDSRGQGSGTRCRQSGRTFRGKPARCPHAPAGCQRRRVRDT